MKDTSRGRYLAELRRSSAAGIHNSGPSRSRARREAIEEELEMSMLDQDYVNEDDLQNGPTPEDMAEMEILESSLLADSEIYDEDYTPADPDDKYVPDYGEEYDYEGYNASNYMDY